MNNPNIPNQPHVICYRSFDGRLRAVNANPGFGLDERFAIYATRHEANKAITYFLDQFLDQILFTVPAQVLFNKETVTKEVFTLRG